MACRLQGAERTLANTLAATWSSPQSTITASYLRRVNLCTADSASPQCSTPISRSLRTRRSTRVTLSSEQRSRERKLIAVKALIGLATCRGRFSFSLFLTQQMGNAAKLFSGRLESLNLLTQLRLLGLLPAQHFMNIP